MIVRRKRDATISSSRSCLYSFAPVSYTHLDVYKRQLQDRVPPFPYVQVKAIIEKETGKKLEDIFEFFSEQPLASASIGQVHKAKLITGEEVVVKVQRPNVADLIEQDLGIIKDLSLIHI